MPKTDQPESGWSLGEMLMDERTRTPDVVMVEADNLRLVIERLDEMDKREATVLRMRFGLNDCPGKTLKEIGERLSLTCERAAARRGRDELQRGMVPRQGNRGGRLSVELRRHQRRCTLTGSVARRKRSEVNCFDGWFARHMSWKH